MADPLGPSILSALFLLFSAFVCALNDALPSMDASELNKKAEQDASAQRMLRLLNRYDNGFGEIRMTYAALIAASFASLAAAVCPRVCAALHVSAALCALIALIPFCIVAFTLTGILPGALAARWPEQTLERIAAPAEWAVWLLTPVTKAAYWIGRALLKPFHLQPANASESVTEEEIRMMVDIGEEKGAIESDEKEMIENIFEFNNMNAEDFMTHRKDITAIDVESTEDEIYETISESGLSRFPVYEDTIDNVIGLLTARDFLINRCSPQPRPFRELIRPAHFVPESVRTDVLFREMQTRKQHMSIVIDEYGGTSGLITLEDLLEEIVGNIYDEFDPKEEQDITPLSDGRYRVAGGVDLETLSEALDIELPLDEEYSTLGGLVFSHLTQIPADGARPVVECCGLRISVTEIADRRVEWAIVEKLPRETKTEEE